MNCARIFLAGTCFILSSSGLMAEGGSLPPAVDAFVAGASSLAKAANDPVDLGRATDRLDRIRSEITGKLLAAKPDDQIKIGLNLTELVCDIRALHIATAARRNYIQ